MIMNTGPLVIRPAFSPTGPGLAPLSALGLPFSVETAAWAVVLLDELHLLINTSGQTLHLLARGPRQIEQLSSLPLVAAGALACGREILVTGSDPLGQPLVFGVAGDGKINWQLALDGPTPVRWPLPACLSQPALVWQVSHGQLEVANCGKQGLTGSRSFSVGGPPLALAMGQGRIWSAWASPSGIRVTGISATHSQEQQLAHPFANNLALGTCPSGACLAWTRNGTTFFKRLSLQAESSEAPTAMELEGASNGVLSLVSGAEPLLWLQNGSSVEDGTRSWVSSFVFPGGEPLQVDGLIHAVTWWNDTLVLLGSQEVRFLKSSFAGPQNV